MEEDSPLYSCKSREVAKRTINNVQGIILQPTKGESFSGWVAENDVAPTWNSFRMIYSIGRNGRIIFGVDLWIPFVYGRKWYRPYIKIFVEWFTWTCQQWANHFRGGFMNFVCLWPKMMAPLQNNLYRMVRSIANNGRIIFGVYLWISFVDGRKWYRPYSPKFFPDDLLDWQQWANHFRSGFMDSVCLWPKMMSPLLPKILSEWFTRLPAVIIIWNFEPANNFYS